MTTPKKPADLVALPDNKPLAKRVAVELERRRRRRKLLLLLLLAAAIALAVSYGTCGRGWGLGGGTGTGAGEGSGPGPGSVQGVMTVLDAGVTRCALRLTATGITVDGKSMTREEAITACKATQGADIVVTGDARTGDWEDLQKAMLEAKLEWVEQKAGGAGSATLPAPTDSGVGSDPLPAPPLDAGLEVDAL